MLLCVLTVSSLRKECICIILICRVVKTKTNTVRIQEATAWIQWVSETYKNIYINMYIFFWLFQRLKTYLILGSPSGFLVFFHFTEKQKSFCFSDHLAPILFRAFSRRSFISHTQVLNMFFYWTIISEVLSRFSFTVFADVVIHTLPRHNKVKNFVRYFGIGHSRKVAVKHKKQLF